MALAADPSMAIVLLLSIYCLMYFPLFVGVLCLSLFWLLCVYSSFAIILKRKRKLVAFLLLSYRCIVTINVLRLFLTVPWGGLQCVIVVFSDHTHLLFDFYAILSYSPGLDIKLEFTPKFKIKRNDWLLADTYPPAANLCTLFWV